jgi:hypothetical protein
MSESQMLLRMFDVAMRIFFSSRTRRRSRRMAAIDSGFAWHWEGDRAATASGVVAPLSPVLATPTSIQATRESDNPDYLRLREETLIPGLRKAGLPEQ